MTFSYNNNKDEFNIKIDSKPDGIESNWFSELVSESIINKIKNKKKDPIIIFLNLALTIE